MNVMHMMMLPEIWCTYIGSMMTVKGLQDLPASGFKDFESALNFESKLCPDFGRTGP